MIVKVESLQTTLPELELSYHEMPFRTLTHKQQDSDLSLPCTYQHLSTKNVSRISLKVRM